MIRIGFFLMGLMLVSAYALAQTPRLKQGVCGKVLWKAGNQMPSPDNKNILAKGSPVVREIYIYELTTEKQTISSEEAGFYKAVQTKLVKKVTTDKKGKFSVRLPDGYYSLFIKEEKGLYANQFDDAMNINPIQISKGKWVKADFIIDYAAVY
ncbi:MAG: carboxypeptidase regulatory-like domain-containing protein [Spirosomataceae bacterium]